jgi:hypothetical protein
LSLTLFEFGNTAFLFVFLVCTLRIALDFREWTWLTFVVVLLDEKVNFAQSLVVFLAGTWPFG